MLRPIAQDRRLLDRLKAFTNAGELLHDAAKVGTVIGRLLEPLELLERRFHTLADHGHFRADLRALRLDRAPQRLDRGGRVAGIVGHCLRLESCPLVVLPDRHGPIPCKPKSRWSAWLTAAMSPASSRPNTSPTF